MNETLLVNYRIQGQEGHGKYTFDYHSHQEYEIYFFHAGSCRYLIHNQIYDLVPGDILLMDGMTLHRPNIRPNSEYIRSVIHFSPQWIKGVLNELGSMYLLEAFQTLQHCLIRTNENTESKRLEDVIRRLAELKKLSESNNIEPETEMKVLLLQVLIIVHRLGHEEFTITPNEKTDKAEHAENIATYVQLNFMKKLTLVSIADALNLSKSYVSHVFKEMTGFTVMEYVMGCRLTQVKYLLEVEPDKPLKEIAHECGFESVSHFSRYFREKVGVTAKEYRRLRLR
ncbi:AraC family transcriptional regulator [Alkalihalobacillus deserti]|uniref:AraC family transcriptional regulator n=1 Tax=Alkalihalobacillus deserti TaxID=2879466 RepID=UPI001D14A517|nr:helix-turn-helix domain-containing protein [Alkalihalobacillus deserti]